ncbi:hypothetical protein TrST_g9121 [Triparma strigata]|uniref:Uncharacterized protein n=1 Tax=Triparma strigata TaxID=1606541 RepID=A0A9W7AIT6_9STRA|nr:hypothetical protein TrST_g9121 [Triparma strigata]
MTLLAAILTMGMAVHDTSMFPFFSTLRASEPPSSSTLATAYGLPEDQQCDEVNIFEKGQEAASRPPPSSTLATTYGLSEAQQATYSLPEAQQDDEVNIFSLSEVQQDDEVKVTEKGHEAASMLPTSSTLTTAYGLSEVQQGNETNNITSTSMGVNLHSSKGNGVPVSADGKQESFRQKISKGALASKKNFDSGRYSWCTLLNASEIHDLNKYDADETDTRFSEKVAWALGQHVLSTPMCSPHLPQNVQAIPRPQRQKPDLKYTLESSVVVSQTFQPVSKFEFNDAQAGSKGSALTPSLRSSVASKQGGTSVGSDQVEEVEEWEHFCASLPSLINLPPIAADIILGGELIQVVVVISLVAVIAAVASTSCNLKVSVEQATITYQEVKISH